MLRQVKAEAESYLAEKAAALNAAGLSRVSVVALAGSGAEEIVRYAQTHRDALVVMCTHGRSGISRWVLGSVTERVVRHSDVPVLVLHGS
jgi:nucleotide-binding universal stress UspA family protein